MVYEMDAKYITGGNASRIGFTFIRQAHAHIFVQGNTVYYRNSSGAITSAQYTTTAKWETDADWHLKFVVKLNDYIQMIITDNGNNDAEICDVTISKTEFPELATMSLYEKNQTYGPNFFAYDTECTLSNFYVGYDLTAEVTALETAIETAETEAAKLTNPSPTVTSTITSASTILTAAKVGNALKSEVTEAITALSELVYENAEPSAIYSKSIIGEENVLTGTSGNLPDAESKYFHRIFTEGQTVLTDADIMVFETDAKCTKSNQNTRVGFTFVRKDVGNLFVQGTDVYYGNDGVGKKLDNVTVASSWQEGSNWHFKVIVQPTESVRMIITDNADNDSEVCDITVEWSNFGTLAEPYAPHFFIKTDGGTACELTNIDVRYDITAEVAALEAAVETAKSTMAELTNPSATVTNTIASANTTLETAKAGNGLKSDVTAATAALSDLNYQEATNFTVGDGTTVTQVSISIAAGETLPTGWNEDKYIIDWTYNGEKVTTYATNTDAANYVPNFIDKKMLVVKTQTKAENNKVTARFIGSLDDYQDADYDYVGFVLSTTTADPLQATNHLDKPIHVVWDAIYASGVLKTAVDIYSSYSNYLFALDVEGLTAGKTVYARAYVKLANGQTVYGDACEIEIK